MSNYKEQLLELGSLDSLQLSHQDLHAKVQRTISTTFLRMWGILLLAFTTGYGLASWLLPIAVTPLMYIISVLGWFGIVLLMSRKRQSLSYTTLASLLVIFGLLEWIGLTGVFLTYSGASIFQVFLISSVMFFWLAIAGYVLHIDIARVGPVLMVALFALIIGLLINIFRWNSTFDLWLSVIGLIVFAWLVLYDMQVLKQQALIADDRLPLLMALGLFLNFINIFFFLLRLFGSRE